MKLFDKLKSIGANAAATLIEKTGKAVDSLITSKEEAMALNNELAKIANEHEEEMETLRIKEIELELKDIDSARVMQAEALKQADLFSKRFIYYLTAGLLFAVLLYDFLLFFVHYPPENRDMINFISGTLNATGFVAIINFFYGSSKGSKDAGERMDKMLNK